MAATASGRRAGGLLVYIHEAFRRLHPSPLHRPDPHRSGAELFLSQATRVLPLGTAYAIWTGIGAVGAVVVGIVIFKEPVTALRMVFVVLLLTGIIGLKATSGH